MNQFINMLKKSFLINQIIKNKNYLFWNAINFLEHMHTETFRLIFKNYYQKIKYKKFSLKFWQRLQKKLHYLVLLIKEVHGRIEKILYCCHQKKMKYFDNRAWKMRKPFCEVDFFPSDLCGNQCESSTRNLSNTFFFKE